VVQLDGPRLQGLAARKRQQFSRQCGRAVRLLANVNLRKPLTTISGLSLTKNCGGIFLPTSETTD
jgi:hypothetical protein